MRHTLVGALGLTAVVSALAFSACGGCDDEESTKRTAEKRSEDGATIPEFDAGSIHTETITPEVLLPVIQAIGFHAVTPNRVTVQFSRNVIDDAPRASSDDTVFEITPATPGSLTFTTNSTLEFVPRDGFAPDTTYEISISSVGSRKGPQIPDVPWTHSFTTPPFDFIGLSGAYLDETTKQVEIEVPAGIEHGQRIRLRGGGHAGEPGGRPGDLYVEVQVSADERFERDGDDLVTFLDVAATEAMLGGEQVVETLDGPQPVAIPAGAQPGSEARLRGMGLPRLRGGRRGDHRIYFNVVVPVGLDEEQRELAEQLAATITADNLTPRSENGFFSRLRKAFT